MVFAHSGGAGIGGRRPSELQVTASLSSLLKARCFEFAFDLTERQRLHAALMSTSISRTRGVIVATGGVKCSSRASRRFSRASSSVVPWLATSTCMHCAMYHSPSCDMLAENDRFITCSHPLEVLLSLAQEPRLHNGPRIAKGFQKGGSFRLLASPAILFDRLPLFSTRFFEFL